MPQQLHSFKTVFCPRDFVACLIQEMTYEIQVIQFILNHRIFLAIAAPEESCVRVEAVRKLSREIVRPEAGSRTTRLKV